MSHLQHIGHPVAGDTVYGGEQRALNDADTDALKHALAQLKRQALHARLLGFEHPATGESLDVFSTDAERYAAGRRCLANRRKL